MLARSARLPARGAWAHEVKWDGFRAIVSTEASLGVRSRRGWDMTPHVRFLAQLPVRAVLDGEIVAFDAEGKPDFPLVCEAVLHGRSSPRLTFVAFDVLSLEGRSVMDEPYSQRRRLLAEIGLDGPRWRVPEAFDDGGALWKAVCEHELEGLVAKRLNEGYRPGERGWIKVKNRGYWRWELEREGYASRRARATT